VVCKSKQYVFHSPVDYTRPVVDLRRAFKWALERAGLPHMRIHDLRHSFATMATTIGEDIRTLKDVLGHTKITTTEIYAHTNSNAARQTANNVANAIIA
jgi:site-specific recombinase XerD